MRKFCAAVASVGAVVGVLIAGTGTAAAAPVSMGTLHPSSEDRHLKSTTLTATQGSFNVTQPQLENISAVLRAARNGKPISGRLIQFTTTSGRLLGKAYTDETGMAKISASENFGPGTAQELASGYTATFFGDGEHAPVQAHGPITVGTDAQL